MLYGFFRRAVQGSLLFENSGEGELVRSGPAQLIRDTVFQLVRAERLRGKAAQAHLVVFLVCGDGIKMCGVGARAHSVRKLIDCLDLECRPDGRSATAPENLNLVVRSDTDRVDHALSRAGLDLLCLTGHRQCGSKCLRHIDIGRAAREYQHSDGDQGRGRDLPQSLSHKRQR